MKHSRRKSQSIQTVRLRFDHLEGRALLSTVSCTLTNGVLATAFCTTHDFIEVDLNQASQTISLSYDFQTFNFRAADVQSVRITGLEGNDLILLDKNLGLPTFLGGTLNGTDLTGWVEVNPQPGSPVVHEHQSSGYVHWVLSSWTYQNGWDFIPGNNGPVGNQVAQSAASLSQVSVGSFTLGGDAFLGGHLFHALASDTNLSLVDFAGMSVHAMGFIPGSADSGHGVGGASHDYLANPPYQEVGHKPG
jgi:hypothetical protein